MSAASRHDYYISRDKPSQNAALGPFLARPDNLPCTFTAICWSYSTSATMSELKPGYTHGRSQSSAPLLPYSDDSHATHFTSTFRGKGRGLSFIPHRRRSLFVLIAFASVISLGLLASRVVTRGLSAESDVYVRAAQDVPFPGTQQQHDLSENGDNASANWTIPPALEDEQVVQYPPWVLGAPTQSFRDNLRPDTQYITSWISAGWSTSFGHTKSYTSS